MQLAIAHLVDEAVLVALGLGHKLLGTAVAVAGAGGIANEVAVVDFEQDSLDEARGTFLWVKLCCYGRRPRKLQLGELDL